ncbi:RNA polymerase sigma factor [Ekhidna sp.]
MKGESFKNEEIVQIIQNGNKHEKSRVLAYLYKLHYPKISKYIRNNRGDEAEAKDVFQDGLLVLYNQIEDGKFEGRSSVGTYLFTIVKNFWRAECKRKQKVLNIPIEENHLMENQTIEDLFSSQEDVRKLDMLFGKLGKGCKDLLTSFFYHEQKVSEIKEKLSLGSDQAVRTKKFRCLQKLTAIFKESKITKDQFSIEY